MKVFLCHNHSDKARIHEICGYFPPHVVSWLDEDDLLLGEPFDNVIEDAILRRADFFVAFLTPRSAASDYIRKELGWALSREADLKRPFLIPVLLEPPTAFCGWPDDLRKIVIEKHRLVCHEQDREQLRLAGTRLADHLLRLKAKYLDKSGRTLEDLIEDAESQLRNRNYLDCQETLNEVLLKSPDSPDALWLFHLLCFEKACLARDEEVRRRITKSCMDYYDAAIRADARLRFLPESYKVEGPLGFGGLSHVYDVTNGTARYAAKLIRSEVLTNKSQRTQLIDDLPRIQKMGEEASSADGNAMGIARILEWHQLGGRLAVIYEYIDGKSLQHHLDAIRKHHPDEVGTERHYQRSLGLLKQVCEALSFAHEHAVYHLDVSPKNILVSDGGGVWNQKSRVKLIDFDMARLAAGSSGMSVTVAISYATTQYIDPRFLERAEFPLRPEELRRADLYSVGRTAKALFCGTPDSNWKPSEASSAASPILDEMISAATEGQPSEQFGNAAEMGRCFRYLIERRKARSLEKFYWSAAGMTAALLAVYLVLLFPLLHFGLGGDILSIALVLCGILSGGPLLYAAYYDFSRADATIGSPWQRRITDIVCLLWAVCSIVVLLRPFLYLLAWAAAVGAGGVRLQLYRPSMRNASRAWQKTSEGIPFLVLGVILCVLGFGTQVVIARMYPNQWALAPIVYTLVAVFFAQQNLRSCRKDWEVKLASLSKARGWKNLTDDDRVC